MSVLLVDKPAGITSHDVVDHVRAVTGVRRVGHAGTLDPFATGLLIVLVGREATRHQEKFLRLPKTYEATLYLGATSTTGDPEGKIVEKSTTPSAGRQRVKQRDLKEVLNAFVGTYDQRPPRFSAKKVGGTKAYELARKGKEVTLKPKAVTIYSLQLLSYTPDVRIETTVSSGTYIRALARDIGEKLSIGAYLTQLRRTAIGPFMVGRAVTINNLADKSLEGYSLRVDEALRQLETYDILNQHR